METFPNSFVFSNRVKTYTNIWLDSYVWILYRFIFIVVSLHTCTVQ